MCRQCNTEVLLLEGTLELGAKRLLHLLTNQLNTGWQTLTGSECLSHQVEGFRKLGSKFAQATLPHPPDVSQWQQGEHESSDWSE